jgi:hypothetical protein
MALALRVLAGHRRFSGHGSQQFLGLFEAHAAPWQVFEPVATRASAIARVECRWRLDGYVDDDICQFTGWPGQGGAQPPGGRTARRPKHQRRRRRAA